MSKAPKSKGLPSAGTPAKKTPLTIGHKFATGSDRDVATLKGLLVLLGESRDNIKLVTATNATVKLLLERFAWAVGEGHVEINVVNLDALVSFNPKEIKDEEWIQTMDSI